MLYAAPGSRNTILFSNQLPVQTLPVYIYTALLSRCSPDQSRDTNCGRYNSRMGELEPYAEAVASDPAHSDGSSSPLHCSAGIILGESKRTNVPAKAIRIGKIKKIVGEDDTAAVSSPGAHAAQRLPGPGGPASGNAHAAQRLQVRGVPASGRDDEELDVDEEESETRVQGPNPYYPPPQQEPPPQQPPQQQTSEGNSDTEGKFPSRSQGSAGSCSISG